VFGLGLATKIYVAVEAVDMRKGFEGLYGLVRDQLGADPLNGAPVSILQSHAHTP
jgi:transposase